MDNNFNNNNGFGENPYNANVNNNNGPVDLNKGGNVQMGNNAGYQSTDPQLSGQYNDPGFNQAQGQYNTPYNTGTPQDNYGQSNYGQTGYAYGQNNYGQNNYGQNAYGQGVNQGLPADAYSKGQAYFISGIVMTVLAALCCSFLGLVPSILSIVFSVRAKNDAQNNDAVAYASDIKFTKIITIVGWIFMALNLIATFIVGVATIFSEYEF